MVKGLDGATMEIACKVKLKEESIDYWALVEKTVQGWQSQLTDENFGTLMNDDLVSLELTSNLYPPLMDRWGCLKYSSTTKQEQQINKRGYGPCLKEIKGNLDRLIEAYEEDKKPTLSDVATKPRIC